MQESNTSKVKFIIGIIALILSDLLVSYFLINYQKDWIMLAGIIIFAIIFLKCFRYEEFERHIYKSFAKHINLMSIILILIAFSLLPDSAAALVDTQYQGILYFFSYLCWFVGLYMQTIKHEYK